MYNRRLSTEDSQHPAGAHQAEGGEREVGTQDRRFQLDPLYVENPLAPATNVTRNSFRIYRVQQTFADALVALRNGRCLVFMCVSPCVLACLLA